MSIGSGLASQFGFAKETTFGTPATIDTFVEIEETDIQTTTEQDDAPVLGDLYLKTSDSETIVTGAEGDVKLPVMTKGMLRVFEQMLGSVTSAQVASTAEYKHTFTPHALGGVGISATAQVGKPIAGGAVQPFTFAGGKITEWELSVALREAVKLKLTWLFSSATTATALAAKSYVSGRRQFRWSTTTITWGGTAVSLESFKLSNKRAVDDKRYELGSIVRAEPIPNGMSELTGDAEGEFRSLDIYNDAKAGTVRQMIVTITGAMIPTTSNPYKIVITLPAVQLVDPIEPEVPGPEILMQPIKFRVLSNGTDPVITIDVHSDETTV